MKAVALKSTSDIGHPKGQRNGHINPPPVSPWFAQLSSIPGAVIQRKVGCACGGGCAECKEELDEHNVQPKLTISTPGDPFEQEADRIADQVMRMPQPEHPDPDGHKSTRRDEIIEIAQIQSKSLDGTAGRWIQRQIGKAEIEEELVKGLVASGATVQRQIDEREERETDEEEEEKLMRAEATGGSIHPPAMNARPKIRSLEGGGQQLPSTVRDFMEPRFGCDFGHVRVHTDANADDAARAVNALAFTAGRNVVFAAGQYAPETSPGQRLLAHELTHVIQQSRSSSKIQRKIILGGKPYTPTKSYYKYLDANFGPTMVEFIKNMDNGGKPPEYSFVSAEQMGYEVRVRYQITKGMDEAHKGSCEYPDSAHPDYLDSAYWDRKGWMNYVPKSPLPAGKDASDAIESIFAPGAKTRLECMSMTVAVEYYSLLKGLGKSKFDALFPGGAGLEISTRLGSSTHPTFYGAKKLYKNITLTIKSEVLPGDWVYFKNFKDYLAKHPGGYWQGENSVYMGSGNYRGFGVSSLKEADLNGELVKQYNAGLPPADQKAVADLLAEGGGLQLSPVFRPDIAKLAP
jgi:hypothetical protein